MNYADVFRILGMPYIDPIDQDMFNVLDLDLGQGDNLGQGNLIHQMAENGQDLINGLTRHLEEDSESESDDDEIISSILNREEVKKLNRLKGDYISQAARNALKKLGLWKDIEY